MNEFNLAGAFTILMFIHGFGIFLIWRELEKIKEALEKGKK